MPWRLLPRFRRMCYRVGVGVGVGVEVEGVLCRVACGCCGRLYMVVREAAGMDGWMDGVDGQGSCMSVVWNL